MKKQGKIASRTVLGLFVMGIVLMVGISISIGMPMRNRVIETYSDKTYSYTAAAAEFIDGDTIAQYAKTGQKDAYYEEVSRYLTTTADHGGFDYFYVFVPGENELTYIWDADLDPNEDASQLGDTEPYSDENAKAEAQKLVEGTAQKEPHYFKDGEAYVFTGNTVIKDSSGATVAIVAADLKADHLLANVNKLIMGVVFSSLAIMAITMIFYYTYTKRRVVDPIVKLQKATGDIVDNIGRDTVLDVDIHTNDEIEMLAHSIEKMDNNLREYIRQNEVITAEKERIGTELELATKIQADMLPNIFPAFPERFDFDVFASMTPAKEVGGDFYDFFLVNENQLAIVIADVSGKGVPAALFMMMSKILIQNAAMSGLSPAQALEKVNTHICANNREEMFVTVWLGLLDMQTGMLTAANAGHEKPMVMQPQGDFELFKDRSGFVIGGLDGVRYRDYQMQLKKGAKIFVYTDGVVEATDATNAAFGIERTLAAVNEVKGGSPQDILTHVKEKVDAFVGDAAQFDDLTMLCLEYTGTQNEITMDATLENVEQAISYVGKYTKHLPFGHKELYHIEMAVDEIISNVARYAYEQEGKVDIMVQSDEKGISITVSDSGIPYNPLEKEDPDVTLSAEDRGIGGYGIFLVKKMMDEVTYRYEGGKNILTMRKYYPQEQ
ncbi:MAG: SpoIIE family protein phosphatase [Clostridia bacterium]|nr:SpoIIE family protein phosphatase [Clostridia bacterium]